MKSSLARVLERKPNLVIPSHGVVMHDPVTSVAKLIQNLDAVMENYLITRARRANMAGIYKKSKPAMFDP